MQVSPFLYNSVIFTKTEFKNQKEKKMYKYLSTS